MNPKSKIENPKWVWIFAIALTFAFGGVAAQAQQPKKVPRIGLLDFATPAAQSSRNEAFRQGLRELGYIEGQKIVIEYRSAEEKPDRLSELAAELVRLNVDVIVVQNPPVARAVLVATKTIPIVNAGGGDPVTAGLAASLAHPGGSVTGLTSLSGELNPKRLELLKEVLRKIDRVAVLPSPAQGLTAVKVVQSAASDLKIKAEILEVRVAGDLPKAFQTATKARADAVIVLADPTGVFFANVKQLTSLAIKYHLPSMFPDSRYVKAGGLMSYAPDDFALWHRAATYVDKILKGAKPADLPVEQPTKFELVINLKTAKQIGLTIPPNVLARADRVIK
jgi:putative ABC transport system substrate-binding protein